MEDGALRPKLGQNIASDAAGNTYVVFTRPVTNNPDVRSSIFVVKGTPGAAGQAPTWSAPQHLGNSRLVDAEGNLRVAVSPAGQAVVGWLTRAECRPDTYSTAAPTSHLCGYIATAQLTPGTGAWGSTVIATDTPMVGRYPLRYELMIDDAGHVALHHMGWIPVSNGTDPFTPRKAVSWRGSATAPFQRHVFTDQDTQASGMAMDNAGNMLWAAASRANATTDIVVSWGTIAGGFGGAQTLDNSNSTATFGGVHMNARGQAAVQWLQSNGRELARQVATTGAPSQAWALSDLGRPNGGMFVRDSYLIDHALSLHPLIVTAGGEIRAYDLMPAQYLSGDCHVRVRPQGGTAWSSSALPEKAACYNPVADGTVSEVKIRSFNARGDYLVANDLGGWGLYAAASNSMVREYWADGTADKPSVLNFAGSMEGHMSDGLGTLNDNGVATLVYRANYDQLPTAAAPVGISRSGIWNLWGFFYK